MTGAPTNSDEAGQGTFGEAVDAPTAQSRPHRRRSKPTFVAGGFLDGRYRIVRALGEGGMAAVHLADDIFLRRKVALKQLATGGNFASTELELFRKEAAVTGAITHPNVARTYDIGEVDGHHYISMEWLDGETLMQRIRRSPLTSDELRAVAIPLCEGLRAAHEAGIVHRDLKPANVMLVDDSRKVVVMDFGIAGKAGTIPEGEAPSASADLTMWGITSAGRGTPAYMAPEQWRQESGDERTDIYALGVIMYVALSCKSPFDARTIDELEAHHKETPPPNVRDAAPDVDEDLAKLIQRCMEKTPEDRPDSIDTVLDTLHGPQRRRKWATGVIAGALVAALLMLAVNYGIYTVAKRAVLHEVRPGVERLARLVAKSLDVTTLRSIQTEADMKRPEFKTLVQQLQPFAKDTPDIKAVYVLRKTATAGMFTFVVDDQPYDLDADGDKVISPSEAGAPVGLKYDGRAFPAMLRTLSSQTPQSDVQFVQDDWGLSLSGYAPLRDANGQPTEMFVGVDVGNQQLENLRRKLRSVLALTFVLYVLAQAGCSFPTASGSTVWRDLLTRRSS